MLEVLPLMAIVLGADPSCSSWVSADEFSFPPVSGTLSVVDSYFTGMAGAGGGGGGGAFQGGGGPPRALAPGRWSVRGGIGFVGDPTLFLMAVEGDYHLFQNFSFGPLVQLGVTGDELFFAPTLNFQYAFNVPVINPLKPFIQAGLGVAYINDENDDDVGFLVNFGVGLDWFLTDNLAPGTSLLFNFLPDDVIDENFFFSWQVVTLRWIF